MTTEPNKLARINLWSDESIRKLRERGGRALTLLIDKNLSDALDEMFFADSYHPARDDETSRTSAEMVNEVLWYYYEHTFYEKKREKIRRDMAEAGTPVLPNGLQTHCPQGHPYSGENLYVNPAGSRKCRTCMRAACRKYEQKKSQKAAWARS